MPDAIAFKLFAPYNKAVVLLGSFSNWQEIPLKKDETGYFHTTVELEDGVYQYKFRVQSKSWSQKPDEWVEINDPYIREIDQQRGAGITRVKNGDRILDTYSWQHDHQPLPANHELIIYELLVPDFSNKQGNSNSLGTYQDVIKNLDYLSKLGINAIELMPVNHTSQDYNWGYLPSYFFAPQPRYGSTADLKQLIDECHARGIRVLLDQLYNHSSEAHPLLKIDRDLWYYHDRHHPDAPPEDYWGPEFNYEHQDKTLGICPAQQFIEEVVRFWVEEYHIDGIRYDALKELDNSEFLHWATEETRQIAGEKPFYSVGDGMNTHSTPNEPQFLEWSLLQQTPNRDLFEHYKRLISLRKQTPALQSPGIEFIHTDSKHKIIAYVRGNVDETAENKNRNAQIENSQVVVVANFSDQRLVNYQISHPQDGLWQEWTTLHTVEVRDRQLAIDLDAYQAQVFVM